MSIPTPASAAPRSPCDGPARVLSRSDMGAVMLCRCGNLHLNLDFMTLRFEPQAFRELAAMLHGAQRRIDAGTPQGADASNVH
ncbi:MAG TPA: hypothetical protein VMT14_03700 [Burkholderiaceae bacterium]|nr:hypothetical protein [Burkholderiaceae bacterium]